MDYEDYPRYLSAAERKKRAGERATELAQTHGELQPAVAKGVKIATTFWGQSWNRNLEQYQYYENRLPRGRSYIKGGQVLDLRIAKGCIKALVSGTELYEVTINIQPLDEEHWSELKKECSGKIDSLVALLQGKISDSVMTAVTAPDTGLFPTPAEIRFVCTCPDYADLCKHSAAAAYGVGARLDEQPELLFLLRGVDHTELLGSAGDLPIESSPLTEDIGNLSDIFGIEIEDWTGPTDPTDPKLREEGSHDEQSPPKGRKGPAKGVGRKLAPGGQGKRSSGTGGAPKKASRRGAGGPAK